MGPFRRHFGVSVRWGVTLSGERERERERGGGGAEKSGIPGTSRLGPHPPPKKETPKLVIYI